MTFFSTNKEVVRIKNIWFPSLFRSLPVANNYQDQEISPTLLKGILSDANFMATLQSVGK